MKINATLSPPTTESLNKTLQEKQSTIKENLKATKNETFSFGKSVISKETFDRIQQNAIEAKQKRKNEFPVSAQNKAGLEKVQKVPITSELHNRIQQKAIEAKNARKF